MVRWLSKTLLLGLGFLVGAPVEAAEPASAKARDPKAVAADIDREIGQRLAREKITPSASATDEEFLRRVYLDLTGRIPTAAQAAQFLSSTDPQKRSQLIDELLASPLYGQHFGTLWRNRMVRPDANMIRPPDTKALVKWLADGFNSNRPWDQTVREILTVEGATAEKPQGLYYILNGDSRGNPQANIIASSTVQLFLGVQLQCAECHNHPFNDWKQTDFWGVAAFFGRVSGQGGAKGQPGVIGEKAAPAGKGNNNTAPKAGAGASIVIPDTAFKQVGKVVKAKYPGAEEPPLNSDKPFRPALAEWMTTPANRFFAANAVNRLWAHLFGRGFVNPVNDFNENNPASHPELLQLLAREFATSGFDQKHLLRCLCNSAAYQRTSKPARGSQDDNTLFARMELKVLTADMLYDSLCTALESSDLSGKADPKTTPKKGTGLQPVQLSGREQFVAFFTTKEEGSDASEFSHGIPQALRLMNSPIFNKGSAVVERLARGGAKPEQVIDGLYLAVLSRQPAPDELKDAVAYVTKAKNTSEAYAGVLWTLINSSEFIINH